MQKKFNNKIYCKFHKHDHYTGKYSGTVHLIYNLR